MIIDDQIKDKKFWYGINREAVNLSTLSSGKIDQYKYLIYDQIFLSNEKQIVEKAKWNYSPLGKAFKKQTKEQTTTIKDFHISDKKTNKKKNSNSNIFQQNVLSYWVTKKVLN